MTSKPLQCFSLSWFCLWGGFCSPGCSHTVSTHVHDRSEPSYASQKPEVLSQRSPPAGTWHREAATLPLACLLPSQLTSTWLCPLWCLAPCLQPNMSSEHSSEHMNSLQTLAVSTSPPSPFFYPNMSTSLSQGGIHAFVRIFLILLPLSMTDLLQVPGPAEDLALPPPRLLRLALTIAMNYTRPCSRRWMIN